MSVDRFFQRGGIGRDAHEAEADGNDVIGEGGHGVNIFDLKFSGLVQAGVEKPEAELRKFVELDFVAVVDADVVEAREFDDEAVHHALAMIVEARRAGADEIVVAAVVFRGENGASLAPQLHFFVEHGDFDIARENFFHLRAGELREVMAVEDGDALVHGALEAGDLGVGIGPVLAGVVHLKFYVGGEVSEGCVYDVCDHDEINGFVGIVRADAEWQKIIGHGKFFVGHPAGDFDEFVEIGVDVARIFDDGRKAIEDGAADGFGPTDFVR